MEIEGQDAVGYENVVTGIAFPRNDPLGVKTGERCSFKIDSRQDMTCAVSEKDAVRQLPPALRVLLDARLQFVHAVMIAQPDWNESPLRPHSGPTRFADTPQKIRKMSSCRFGADPLNLFSSQMQRTEQQRPSFWAGNWKKKMEKFGTPLNIDNRYRSVEYQAAQKLGVELAGPSTYVGSVYGASQHYAQAFDLTDGRTLVIEADRYRYTAGIVSDFENEEDPANEPAYYAAMTAAAGINLYED
ncbi:hypothetical protein [Marivita sp.]|uniref:hypothetical protein n=1 Tax=Marivita sp. TaxID=2003365 RepID=UPI0025C64458|nr:hypothetical protein [Marivita sp.]